VKLKPREIDAFVRKPDPSVQAILVFGPDQGLAHDRLNKIAKTVVDDLSDPFRVVDMNDTDLKADPARLPDEAAAISMMGGRRIVRIRNASDGLTKIVKPFLENPIGDALILFQAGDLTPRSSLRKLFEGSKKGAIALPCYADDARSLEGIIRETLNNAKLSIEPEALGYLTSHLGSDRGVTLSELNKLTLYMMDPDQSSPQSPSVTLKDVLACVGDTAAIRIDDIVDACAGGDFQALDRALFKAVEADTSPISILMAVTRHMTQLHLILGQVDAGSPQDSAIKALRPPIHFARQGAVKRQCSLWDRRRLDRALTLLAEADQQCKTTGFPDKAICGQALMRIAQGARAPRPRLRS